MLRIVHAVGMGLTLAATTMFAVACKGPEGPEGPQGPQGEQGEQGDPGDDAFADPTVSGVDPEILFLGRIVDVILSGSATEWTDSTAVDFGTGITILDVTAPSPTALIATVEIADDAPLGPRDVTVGGLTYDEGIVVMPPVTELATVGDQEQGGIVLGFYGLADPTTPFTPIDALGLDSTWVDAPEYTNPWLLDVTSTELMVQFNIDVTATTGAVDMTVYTGLFEWESFVPDVLDIGSRTPTPLTPGTDQTGSITDLLQTALYSYTPAHPGEVVSFELTSTSTGEGPVAEVLPASGAWADEIGYGGSFELEVTDTTYFVIVDWDGDYGYDYTIHSEVVSVPPNVGVEDEAHNDACTGATTVHTLPVMIVGYVNASDEDWYAFDVPSADVGKLIHVVTEAPADTQVEVFEPNADCTLANSMTGTVDTGAGEDVITDPTEVSGTYYVEVTPLGASNTGQYTLFVELLGEAGSNDACVDVAIPSVLPLEDAPGWLDDTDDTDDWYQFTLATADEGKAFEVITGAGEYEETDTVVEVFYANTDCANLESLGGPSDDYDYGEHHISQPAPSAGTYYVQVHASEYSWGEGDYTLSVRLVDSEEPTDACADATTVLGLPLQLDASLTDSDSDWFAFEVTSALADSPIDIYTEGRAGTEIYVYEPDTDCNNLVEEDPGYFTGLYGPLDEGTYYVEVTDAGGPRGPYTLVVEPLPFSIVLEDETFLSDPNNDCSVAQEVDDLPFYMFLGYLEDDIDVDWYAIDVGSGDIGNVVYVETCCDVDTVVEVAHGCVDGTPGTSLGGPADFGIDEFHYSTPITTAGTHYVMVAPSPEGGFFLDAYSLWVEVTAPPAP